MIKGIKRHFRIAPLFLVSIILISSACSPAPATPTANSFLVTFSNNQCTYTGSPSIAAGQVTANVEVKDQGFDIALVAVTLDPGNTLRDLRALPNAGQPPNWIHKVGEAKFHGQPDGSRTASFTFNDGPIYLMCFIITPQAIIGAVGPIEVIK